MDREEFASEQMPSIEKAGEGGDGRSPKPNSTKNTMKVSRAERISTSSVGSCGLFHSGSRASSRRRHQLDIPSLDQCEHFDFNFRHRYLEGLLFYVQMQARWSKALHTNTASGLVGKRWTLRAAGQMTKPLAELFFGLVDHVRKLK